MLCVSIPYFFFSFEGFDNVFEGSDHLRAECSMECAAFSQDVMVQVISEDGRMLSNGPFVSFNDTHQQALDKWRQLYQHHIVANFVLYDQTNVPVDSDRLERAKGNVWTLRCIRHAQKSVASLEDLQAMEGSSELDDEDEENGSSFSHLLHGDGDICPECRRVVEIFSQKGWKGYEDYFAKEQERLMIDVKSWDSLRKSKKKPVAPSPMDEIGKRLRRKGKHIALTVAISEGSEPKAIVGISWKVINQVYAIVENFENLENFEDKPWMFKDEKGKGTSVALCRLLWLLRLSTLFKVTQAKIVKDELKARVKELKREGADWKTAWPHTIQSELNIYSKATRGQIPRQRKVGVEKLESFVRRFGDPINEGQRMLTKRDAGGELDELEVDELNARIEKKLREADDSGNADIAYLIPRCDPNDVVFDFYEVVYVCKLDRLRCSKKQQDTTFCRATVVSGGILSYYHLGRPYLREGEAVRSKSVPLVYFGHAGEDQP